MAGGRFWDIAGRSRDGSDETRPWVDWLTRSSESVARRLDEFGKELSICDHRTAQIFRRCLAALVTDCDVVAGAVVFNHVRVVDRDIRHTLLPVRHRISPGRHHFPDEHIG